MKIRNPRSGKFDYEISPPDDEELENICKKARQAQSEWNLIGIDKRCQILSTLADLIERNAHYIASALVDDTGRKKISFIEVIGAVNLIRRWVKSAPSLMLSFESFNQQTSINGISVDTIIDPYQLVGIISPWNFPLTLALIDAIPALLAGCCVIIKPSEVTPRFIKPLNQLISQIPQLSGVLIVIEGDGQTGANLIGHLDYLAFTGSVATGKRVAINAAENFVVASLELGGKDPMIITQNNYPKDAAAIALRSCVVNTGQACQSIERVYVSEEIYDEFVSDIIEMAKKTKLNFPDIDEGHLGPLIYEKQAEIIEAQLDDATSKGAKICTGGKIENLGGGFYIEPTIIINVNHSMDIMKEETFGPIIPIMKFSKLEDAIYLANDSKFGLSAAILSNNAKEVEFIARKISAGAISINDGALTSMVWEAEKNSFKESGIGPSRMGSSGISRFFRRKALIKQNGKPMEIDAYSEGGSKGG